MRTRLYLYPHTTYLRGPTQLTKSCTGTSFHNFSQVQLMGEAACKGLPTRRFPNGSSYNTLATPQKHLAFGSTKNQGENQGENQGGNQTVPNGS